MEKGLTAAWSQLREGRGFVKFAPSMMYFVQCGASAMLTPFLSVILSGKSLTKVQIGIVLACPPLCSFFASPLGGYIYDRSRESKVVWCFFTMAAALSMQLVLLTDNYFALMGIISLTTCFSEPLNSILNHSVMVHLGDNKKDYGRHRLWGAVSWGIVSFVMGIVLTHQPIYWSFGGYLAGYSFCAILIIVFTFTSAHPEPVSEVELEESQVSRLEEGKAGGDLHRADRIIENVDEIDSDTPFALPEPAPPLSMDEKLDTLSDLAPKLDPISDSISEDDSAVQLETSSLRIIFKVMMKREVLVFYFLVYLMGVATSIIWGFLFLFIKDLGGSETLMGISLVFAMATEIPFFFFSGTLLSVFGEVWLIASAMIAYIIRVLGYSILVNPWWVLPLELLHGLSFGAMYAAGIHYSSTLFPPELSATGQGIFSGIFSGLGPLTGSLVGGFMYQTCGPRQMFRVMSFIVSLGLLLLFATFWRELYMRLTIACARLRTLDELFRASNSPKHD